MLRISEAATTDESIDEATTAEVVQNPALPESSVESLETQQATGFGKFDGILENRNLNANDAARRA